MNQGTRWVLLMEKICHRKSHAWAPLTLSLTAYLLHVNALPQVSINLVVRVAYKPSPPSVEEYAVLLLKPSQAANHPHPTYSFHNNMAKALITEFTQLFCEHWQILDIQVGLSLFLFTFLAFYQLRLCQRSHTASEYGGGRLGMSAVAMLGTLPTQHNTIFLKKHSKNFMLQNSHSFFAMYTGAALIPHMGFTDSSHHSNNYWIWLTLWCPVKKCSQKWMKI